MPPMDPVSGSWCGNSAVSQCHNLDFKGECTCVRISPDVDAQRSAKASIARAICQLLCCLLSFVSLSSAVQVPIANREKLLIKGGVDPKKLKNLRLIYKDPQVCTEQELSLCAFANKKLKTGRNDAEMLDATYLHSASCAHQAIQTVFSNSPKLSHSHRMLFLWSGSRKVWLLSHTPQVEGELVSRAGLEALKPEQFSSILILADESTQFAHATGGSQVMDADSRSLAALLLMRDLQTRRMRNQFGKSCPSVLLQACFNSHQCLPGYHLPHGTCPVACLALPATLSCLAH